MSFLSGNNLAWWLQQIPCWCKRFGSDGSEFDVLCIWNNNNCPRRCRNFGHIPTFVIERGKIIISAFIALSIEDTNLLQIYLSCHKGFKKPPWREVLKRGRHNREVGWLQQRSYIKCSLYVVLQAIRRTIDKKTVEVYQLFNEELNLVKKEFNTKTVDLPPMYPIYAGSAAWARMLKRRIDRPMNVSSLSPTWNFCFIWGGVNKWMGF